MNGNSFKNKDVDKKNFEITKIEEKDLIKIL